MTLPLTRRLSLTAMAVLLVAGLGLFVVCCEDSDTETTSSVPSTSSGTATTDSAPAASTTGTSTTGTSAGQRTTTTVPKGETGVVEVKGLVDNPMTLKTEDVEKMNVVTVTVEGPDGKQEHRGVRLSDLFAAFKIRSGATRVAMTAHADGFVVELSLQDIAWSPDALLAIGADGTLNIVIPGFDKKSWVKDLVSMEFK